MLSSKRESADAHIEMLQRAYVSMIYIYIWDTFNKCIENPKRILRWRAITAEHLYLHAQTSRLLFVAPQKDINDFLGLASDIFRERIDDCAVDESVSKRKTIKEIDRQVCNYIRDDLALPDEDDDDMPTGTHFYGIEAEKKKAIMNELSRPLDDFYNKKDKNI